MSDIKSIAQIKQSLNSQVTTKRLFMCNMPEIPGKGFKILLQNIKKKRKNL